jgi:hypothetical protein
MRFRLDTLGTENVCEMLFVANKADLLVSKRQPVLLLCSRSHDPVKVSKPNLACKLHSGRIFSDLPNGRKVKTPTAAAERRRCTSALGT